MEFANINYEKDLKTPIVHDNVVIRRDANKPEIIKFCKDCKTEANDIHSKEQLKKFEKKNDFPIKEKII